MPKTFYIIDGHAQIFRCYFAPFRPLTSPTGEPSKAPYVFAQGLLNLIERRRPDYLVMVIDTGNRKVFRTLLYPEYKAHRPAPPEDFHPQAQRILRMVADAGIPVLGQVGFEADDLIATIAHQLAEQDFQVVVVSRDKDLRQIVTDKVVLYDMQADSFLDAPGIEKEYGYTPAQAVEVQTLTGDSTDNIPGIPGVGEKTAAKLVQKYGSADAVLQHLDELTPKLRENFQKSGAFLAISRQLVTLRNDVPMELDMEKCRFKGINVQGLKTHFEELGLKQLLQRIGAVAKETPAPRVTKGRPANTSADLFGTLPADSNPEPPEPASSAPLAAQGRPADSAGLFGALPDAGPELALAVAQAERVALATPDAPAFPARELSTSDHCDYRLITTEAALDAFVAELRTQKRFAFDTETDALGAMSSNMVGMSFSWKHGTGWYIPVAGPLGSIWLPRQQVIDAVRPILEDPAIGKVGHNIKYDMLVLRCLGVRLRGVRTDSMIAAFLIDSSRFSYGIDRLSAELLHFRKIPTSALIGSGRNQISMEQVDLSRVGRYAAEDADIALRLADLFESQLDQSPALRKLHDDLEIPLIDVLVQMEFDGVSIDPDMLRQQSAVLGERVELLKGQIMEAAGSTFNPDSPKQLGEVLFGKLGLRVIKRNPSGPSTDVEVLEKLSLEHPVPRLILEYRSLVKLKNTYLDTLPQTINPRTHRIHASFSQIGAETGRLSCNDPNLQNIPIRTDEGRRIRLAFVPANRQQDVLITADYSQIELRVLAHFTQEPALMRAFEADEDIHRAVAAEVFGVALDAVTKEQRSQAKVVNFGIIYGVSAFGLARRIEGLSQPAAQKLIDNYHARFPSIKTFLEQCVQQAKQLRYVETILGRRRHLPLIDSRIVVQRNASERMAINSVVQGSAADLIKVAMVNIHRRIERENHPSRMLLQVHDELVFETPRSQVEAEAEMVRHEMEHAMTLRVPVKVDVGWGINWQEGK